MELLVQWLFVLMQGLVPANAAESAPGVVRETSEARLVRYQEIAQAAVKVAFDPEVQPLPEFKGPFARLKTLVLMITVAGEESTFNRDVDLGLDRKNQGKNDGGESWCLMQIHLKDSDKYPNRARTVDGWTGPQLVADREKCFRAGLKLMRWHMKACNGLPREERLVGYTHGSKCLSRRGRSRARYRWRRAVWAWENYSPEWQDADFTCTAKNDNACKKAQAG